MSWSVLGASVAGTSHRARNSECEDAFRCRTFGPVGEWLVVAVADGAGSAAHARRGAERACEGFIRRVETLAPDALLNGDAMAALFAEVRGDLGAEAAQLGVAVRELACTLLVAVVGTAAAAFAQVGDGAIVVGGGGGLRVAFWPEPAGYANATDFLTDGRFADALRFETTAEPIVELALLTDGLQRLALDFAARAAHAAFFRPLFDRLRACNDPESLAEPFRDFLDSPRVNERTDDDKTLVVATRRP